MAAPFGFNVISRADATSCRNRLSGPLAGNVAPNRRLSRALYLVRAQIPRLSRHFWRKSKRNRTLPLKQARAFPYQSSCFIFVLREQTEIVMEKFDYNAPAELFPARHRKVAKKITYRRFDHAADAIRFAVEELPAPLLLGACLEIDEQRLDGKDIQALYDSKDYPLKKRVS
ncbi:MAG TPA: hypothetical protein VHD14_09815 [Pseudolabrys sp.]|nr:hypothetical protein [Pseudolabrys sp.]